MSKPETPCLEWCQCLCGNRKIAHPMLACSFTADPHGHTFGCDNKPNAPKAEAPPAPKCEPHGPHEVCLNCAFEEPAPPANVSEPPNDQWNPDRIATFYADEDVSAPGMAKPLARAYLALKARLDALPADWSKDSSLKTWFPITAQKLEDLKAQNAALEAFIRRAMHTMGTSHVFEAQALLARAAREAGKA